MFRITDVIPRPLLDAAADIPMDAYDLRVDGDNYSVNCRHQSWVTDFCRSSAGDPAQELLMLRSLSRMMHDGPKVFLPTPEQVEALSHVELNVQLQDYSQPYPATLVALRIGDYRAALCHLESGVFVCSLYSGTHSYDVTTMCVRPGMLLEVSLGAFDTSVKDQANAMLATRVAVNSCLALSNYGCTRMWLFPHEVERDKRLAKERSERGTRAAERLRAQPSKLVLDRTVVLRETAAGGCGTGEGQPVAPHWRRGHWAMQPYGPGHSLRKRILRPAVFVHAEAALGPVAVSYKTGGATDVR